MTWRSGYHAIGFQLAQFLVSFMTRQQMFVLITSQRHILIIKLSISSFSIILIHFIPFTFSSHIPVKISPPLFQLLSNFAVDNPVQWGESQKLPRLFKPKYNDGTAKDFLARVYTGSLLSLKHMWQHFPGQINVETTNGSGETPLIVAACNNDLEMVRFLIKTSGANPNVKERIFGRSMQKSITTWPCRLFYQPETPHLR
jgi:hypothetical protein